VSKKVSNHPHTEETKDKIAAAIKDLYDKRGRKDKTIRARVTTAQYDAIQALAHKSGLSLLI
jgi:hypothetical protein